MYVALNVLGVSRTDFDNQAVLFSQRQGKYTQTMVSRQVQPLSLNHGADIE